METNQKSKRNFGTIINSRMYFSDSEKHLMIRELKSSKCTKADIWRKYTGKDDDHGKLIRWMREFGYDTSTNFRKINFAIKTLPMSSKKPVHTDFEKLQLEKRIAELEKKLKEAELKSIAFSTMVDIAEKEFKIPIRKKFNTKPLKK